MHSTFSLRDLLLNGKRVIMRVDFNVPFSAEGVILDDTRIKESLPSIRYILQQGASLILMSHVGRPKGKEATLSLRPIAKRLEELLGQKVTFVPDCVGVEVEEKALKIRSGEVLLLENLRFYEAEEKPEKDPEFAKSLAKLADVFVNDAFGSAHRAHSSTVTIATFFPKERRAIGFLMEKEWTVLTTLLKKPKRPFFGLIGGAKISTKIGVLLSLLDRVDALFLGGAMVYTFMRAMHIDCGVSPVEEGQVEKALKVLQRCKEKQIPLYFPIDLVITDKMGKGGVIKEVLFKQGFNPPFQGVDIGPKTIEVFSALFKQAALIFWNGPLGVYEVPPFNRGTLAMAKALADSEAKVIVGGGDSVAAIYQAKLQDCFAHLSTGGGASLEFIEFGTLPGFEVLEAVLKPDASRFPGSFEPSF